MGAIVSLQQTSLYKEHQNLGAKIVDFAGWEMPIQYKNLKEEVLAVREDVGVFDVSHMGEFLVEGKQALECIDYLVTNDIKGAKNFKAIYSPLCNFEGKVIDDLIVYKYGSEKLLICVNASNIEKDFEWISKNSQDFDCKVTDVSSSYSLLAVQGPNSEALLQTALDIPLAELSYYSFTEHNQLIIARTGYTGEDGFEVFIPNERAVELWNAILNEGAKPCGLGARDVLRTEVCYPLYGQEISEDLTPLDSGLKWTVKFQKENFIGKTALEEYKPTKQLVKILLEQGVPRNGYEIIQNEEVIGTVTSGTMSVMQGKGIALALVDKNKYCAEGKIFVKIRNRNYEGLLKKKPFYAGGHK